MARVRITFTGCYTQPGFSYHFSHLFFKWLERELAKRVEASEAFTQTYPGFSVVIWLNAHSDILEPVIRGSTVRKRDKEIEVYLVLPHAGGPCPTSPKAYKKPVKWLLESVAEVLRRLGLDPTRLVQGTPTLVQHFVRTPDNIANHDWANEDVELQSKSRNTVPKPVPAPWGAAKSSHAAVKYTKKRQSKTKPMALPIWKIPKNIQKRVDDEDGMWEDERFDPILLTVMSEVEHEGRDIPLSWQIEFDPFDDRLEAANEKLESSGIEPDGDGWAEVIEKEFAKRYPKLAGELHSDSESSTCVLWVESEKTCQKLIELVWALIHAK